VPPPAPPPNQALPLLAAGPSPAQKIKMILELLEICVGTEKKQTWVSVSVADPGSKVFQGSKKHGSWIRIRNTSIGNFSWRILIRILPSIMMQIFLILNFNG
jgi:hypothetical protein